MLVDEKIKDEKLNTILIEKPQKNQPYHQVRLTDMIILWANIIFSFKSNNTTS